MAGDYVDDVFAKTVDDHGSVGDGEYHSNRDSGEYLKNDVDSGGQ